MTLAEAFSDCFHGLPCQRSAEPGRNSHQQARLANQSNRQRLGFKLDPPISAPDFECVPRLQIGFPPDLLGDDQASGRVYGNFRGICY